VEEKCRKMMRRMILMGRKFGANLRAFVDFGLEY
jgi:hypothetical protein